MVWPDRSSISLLSSKIKRSQTGLICAVWTIRWTPPPQDIHSLQTPAAVALGVEVADMQHCSSARFYVRKKNPIDLVPELE